ncbi:MAG: hypothetical protein ABIV48_03365 [Pyrinomonadaceae bacterium]
MKSIKYSSILLVALMLAAGLAVFAQGDTFNDAHVDYSFALPEQKWKMTVKPSATSPNVEYVYGDRYDGHLEVRKITVAKDAILTDVIRDEELKLQFRPGYVSGKEENFSGKLRGSIFNFEYVAAGRNMSGRFYFLKGADTTVYILRFTGQKDSLRSLRNQTDSIARTFGTNL